MLSSAGGLVRVLGALALVAFATMGCADTSWDGTTRENTVPAYTRFLRDNPESSHAKAAEERIAFLRVMAHKTIEGHERFVQSYPNSPLAAELAAAMEPMVGADGIWVAESIELLDTKQATGFAFFGQVLNINPWNVGGVPLTVDERTTIQDGIVLGEMVKVTGWIQEDGTWLATDIKHTGLHLGQGCFMIYSVVQNVTGDQILLTNGQTIVRSGDLVVTGDLREASMVVYQYCVDKQGQGKIMHITVVDQLGELPPAKAVICHIPNGGAVNPVQGDVVR